MVSITIIEVFIHSLIGKITNYKVYCKWWSWVFKYSI